MKSNRYVTIMALSMTAMAFLAATQVSAEVGINGRTDYIAKNSHGDTVVPPQTGNPPFVDPIFNSIDVTNWGSSEKDKHQANIHDFSHDRSIFLQSQVQTTNIVGKKVGIGGASIPSETTQTRDGFSQGDIFDSLRVSGEHGTSNKVTLHQKLKFNYTLSAGVVNPLVTDIQEEFPHGTESITLKAFNATISGGTTFDQIAFSNANGVLSALDVSGGVGANHPTEVLLDFSLSMDFDNASSFDLMLLEEFSHTFLEHADHSKENYGISSGGSFNVAFLDGISITDDVTHKDLCGLTVTRASGEVWGQTDACQVDPGNGGGDPGNGGGAVPEPASWALMLGGFGLVGGALRASRRRAVAAA